MREQDERTALLLGEDGVIGLHNKRVAVFGIGGVGGYAVEALARAGIGTLDLIDRDVVSVTNINRQILATHDTVGMPKTEAARQRIASISPETKVNVYQTFYLPQTESDFDFTQYDYVIDAIDTVTGKISLVMKAQEAGTPIISAMGAGNKLDPSRFEVADIYQTSVCPLAKVMRRELKKRGVKRLKVVYSRELPVRAAVECGDERMPGSISFVPSVMGLIMAGEVVRDLVRKSKLQKID